MISYPNVKLNLGLNVLRRRTDGYHDIETLFIPYFGFRDTLEIETSGHLDIAISKKGGVDWDPLKDLTIRAYEALARDFDIPPVKIFLEKNSPVGAGLGGGSADAAFALRMYSELFGLGLSDESLASYAAGLGSDCAFFIYNRPMIGTGRGEVLEPFDLDLSSYEIKVTVPEGLSVSTADAYRGITPREPVVSLRDALSRPVEQWRELLSNDFETTVFAKYPQLQDAKRQLYDEGAVYASMSGSGSALFGIFKK